MNEKYADIIDLPHPNSKNHIRMPRSSRAAQFAPFAALTGHSAAIKETARITEQKIELDESMKELLNEKLLLLEQKFKDQPLVTIIFFVADKNKSGGLYLSSTGFIKKFIKNQHLIIMSDNCIIPINDILKIKMR